MSNLSFTYKWQAQPYVPWKGASTNSAVPTYSQPLQKNETQQNGPSFSARPIKHWRKQLNPRPGSGRGRPGVGMPMDVPGGSVYLGSDSSNCVVCGQDGLSNSTGLKNNILRDNGQKAATFMLSPKYNASANILEGVGNNKENVCVACNPENNRIRSAIQDTGYLGRYHYTSQSYLRARGNLYNQKSTTNADISGVQYIDPATGLEYWPTNNKSGIAPQIRGTQYCLSQAVIGDLANGTWDPSTRYCRADTTIYKPNNRQYATQGAVSSSSRILRLQYNTITKNGNSSVPHGETKEQMLVNTEGLPQHHISSSPRTKLVSRIFATGLLETILSVFIRLLVVSAKSLMQVNPIFQVDASPKM